jgi:hypothetical protein
MTRPAPVTAITPRRFQRRGVIVCGIANRSRRVRSVTANGLRTLIKYDAFGFAVRRKFRGSTDAVVVAPDAQSAVITCVLNR